MPVHVGQRVFLRPIGTLACLGKYARDCQVIRVGRKYFEVAESKKSYNPITFQLKTLKNVSAGSDKDWILFLACN